MVETLFHCGWLLFLAAACLYAGSDPKPVDRRLTARGVYFPDSQADAVTSGGTVDA